jgi:hypothetical protein
VLYYEGCDGGLEEDKEDNEGCVEFWLCQFVIEIHDIPLSNALGRTKYGIAFCAALHSFWIDEAMRCVRVEN